MSLKCNNHFPWNKERTEIFHHIPSDPQYFQKQTWKNENIQRKCLTTRHYYISSLTVYKIRTVHYSTVTPLDSTQPQSCNSASFLCHWDEIWTPNVNNFDLRQFRFYWRIYSPKGDTRLQNRTGDWGARVCFLLQNFV